MGRYLDLADQTLRAPPHRPNGPATVGRERKAVAATAAQPSEKSELSEKSAGSAHTSIPEHEAGMPPDWRDGVARLLVWPCPTAITPARWQQLRADARVFLDRWGAQAAALGWSVVEVFGCHPTKPDIALDGAGLVALMHGDEIVAITVDGARLRTPSGAIQSFRRSCLPDAVPLWALTE